MSVENPTVEEEKKGRGAKNRPTPGRRSGNKAKAVTTKKQSQGNIITRPFLAVFRFIGEVRDELDKVTWPTREETIRLSRIVLVVTIASAIVLGLLSLLFSELFLAGLDNPILLLAVIAGAFLIAGYFWWRDRTSHPSF